MIDIEEIDYFLGQLDLTDEEYEKWVDFLMPSDEEDEQV